MDNPFLKLTVTDRQILNSYALMLNGLGAYLGDGYELVLHSLESLDHSVIKIINGHFTGRKEGSPITDLALKMLGELNRILHVLFLLISIKAVLIQCFALVQFLLQANTAGLSVYFA